MHALIQLVIIANQYIWNSEHTKSPSIRAIRI